MDISDKNLRKLPIDRDMKKTFEAVGKICKARKCTPNDKRESVSDREI